MRGQSDSLGTPFFLAEGIEGLRVIQRETGTRRKGFSGTLEKVKERWEKSWVNQQEAGF